MTQLCLFFPVGCKVELLSNAVKKHNEKCVAIHLGYTFEAFQNEKKLVEKLAKENEELKEVSIPKLLEIVEKLQRGNGDLQGVVEKLQKGNGELQEIVQKLRETH